MKVKVNVEMFYCTSRVGKDGFNFGSTNSLPFSSCPSLCHVELIFHLFGTMIFKE
jgi:hypothetical protein